MKQRFLKSTYVALVLSLVAYSCGGGNDDKDEVEAGEACVTYCQTMSDAGCFALSSAVGFGDNDACLTACGMYNATGQDGALQGNTLQCRQQHASLALMFKDVNNGDIHCTHAGVGGGNICIDVPPTSEEELAANYCAKITMFCPEQGAMAFMNCEMEVAALLTAGTFTTDGGAADTTGKTIQCLTNTAILAGLVDQALCGSALPDSTTCVAAE